MKRITKSIGQINIFLIIAYSFIWGIALLSQGLAGVVMWVVLKLLIPFVGAAILIIGTIRCIKHRRSNKAKHFITIAVSFLYLFPMLITTNVIPMAYPTNVNTAAPAAVVSWPLTEETIVTWGGDSIEDNLPHAMWGSERWAYDLVMEPYNTGDPDLESYGIWNKEVISPIYGTVIAVNDQEEDIPPNLDEFNSLEGNYVYLKIKETGTYLLLNHLKQGSITVAVGDTVEPGDLLGRVGNSGTSSEPHLHIHHQRQDPTSVLHPLFAQGLPLYFDTLPDVSMPTSGMTIFP